MSLFYNVAFIAYPITNRVINLKKGDHLIVECLSQNDTVFIKSIPNLEKEETMQMNKSSLFHNKDFLSFYKSAEILISKTFNSNSSKSIQVGRVECVRKMDNQIMYQWQYRVSNG